MIIIVPRCGVLIHGDKSSITVPRVMVALPIDHCDLNSLPDYKCATNLIETEEEESGMMATSQPALHSEQQVTAFLIEHALFSCKSI